MRGLWASAAVLVCVVTIAQTPADAIPVRKGVDRKAVAARVVQQLEHDMLGKAGDRPASPMRFARAQGVGNFGGSSSFYPLSGDPFIQQAGPKTIADRSVPPDSEGGNPIPPMDESLRNAKVLDSTTQTATDDPEVDPRDFPAADESTEADDKEEDKAPETSAQNGISFWKTGTTPSGDSSDGEKDDEESDDGAAASGSGDKLRLKSVHDVVGKGGVTTAVAEFARFSTTAAKPAEAKELEGSGWSGVGEVSPASGSSRFQAKPAQEDAEDPKGEPKSESDLQAMEKNVESKERYLQMLREQSDAQKQVAEEELSSIEQQIRQTKKEIAALEKDNKLLKSKVASMSSQDIEQQDKIDNLKNGF